MATYSFDITVPAGGTYNTATIKEVKVIHGNIDYVIIESGSTERKVNVIIECDGNRILPSSGADVYSITPPDQAHTYPIKFRNHRDLGTFKVIAWNTDTTNAFSLKVVVEVVMD